MPTGGEPSARGIAGSSTDLFVVAIDANENETEQVIAAARIGEHTSADGSSDVHVIAQALQDTNFE